MAEGVGFEPTLRFPVNTLSKRAPSATRPPLRTALPEGARTPWGTSTCAEGGLFSRPCGAIGPVRWGGTIVVTIGLTRHCRNRRQVALALRPALAGVSGPGRFALLPSRGAGHIVKATWTNPS